MGCSGIFVSIVFALLLMLRACSSFSEPEPAWVGWAPGLVGEWSMYSHDLHGAGDYVKDKSLVLHADGRAESRNLLRQDVMPVHDGTQETPLPQFGTWALVEGESPEASTLVVNFGQPVELMTKFYRKNSWFSFGELEIWFRLEQDPDVPLWSYLRRPKLEPVQVEASAIVGEWQMSKHHCSSDLQYGLGKRLVLHVDGTGECHGMTWNDLLMNGDGDETTGNQLIPTAISWKLREDGWIELWQKGEFLTHARMYGAEGEEKQELRLELSLEPFDPYWAYFERQEAPEAPTGN